MSKRSPEFLLVTFGVLLAISLAAAVLAHSRYLTANTKYENHLKYVVITPRSNVRAELAAEAQAVNRWLNVRTATSVVATVAIVGIVWQVVRRRNERVARSSSIETVVAEPES